MANARVEMLGSAKREQLLKLTPKIYSKIGDNYITKRQIYHPLGIPVALCEEALHAMEAAGFVCDQEGKWKRVPSRQLLDDELQELFIEV